MSKKPRCIHCGVKLRIVNARTIADYWVHRPGGNVMCEPKGNSPHRAHPDDYSLGGATAPRK